MKKIAIKYNPYHIETQICIDGHPLKANSKLHFRKLRLQEWADEIPELLVNECNDREYAVHFIGTPTDYADLKSGLMSKSDILTVTQWSREEQIPDVEAVEAEIDKIFIEIQNGPVESLKDAMIKHAFSKAKDQEFEVNVVATMSSGKSTLINALIDKKLMPVANTAMTATIVRIIDTDRDGFSATAFDSEGNVIHRDDDIQYATMKEWNADKSISTIDIYGRIPCVNSVGMKLILVDTPGPNNARNGEHQKMTYKMLNDSDKSLVLFVLNGTNLCVNDEANFLDYICECMREGGKQSRERFIFAVNKMDSFDPEEEDIRLALKQVAEVLESRGILSPNIYPVSAQVALEVRTNPVRHSALDSFESYLKDFPQMEFDAYYDFNHLPHSSQKSVKRLLNDVDDSGKVEIHSGIVSIEEAIKLYVNKYARALKVKDLVESFNNRLKELAAIESLKEDIRINEDKKKQLNEKITAIRTVIDSGKSAQVLASLIDKKDFRKNVTDEIDPFIISLEKKISKIIFGYTNLSKVKKVDAINQVKGLQKESSDLLSQLEAKVEDILGNAFKLLYADILDTYQQHLATLGMALDERELGLNPLDFVAENLSNLDSLMRKSSHIEDEGKYETRSKTQRVTKERKRSIFKPWNYFRSKTYTVEEIKTWEEWVPNEVEYVDMSSVASNYFQPIQIQLQEAKKSASEHAQAEGGRIKGMLKEVLGEVDGILSAKLSELQISMDDATVTEKYIKRQQTNLRWMENIIERVNKLINF